MVEEMISSSGEVVEAPTPIGMPMNLGVVYRTIASVLGIDRSAVTLHANIFDDLDGDSVDLYEIAEVLEGVFSHNYTDGFRIDRHEVQGIRTVMGLVILLQQKGVPDL